MSSKLHEVVTLVYSEIRFENDSPVMQLVSAHWCFENKSLLFFLRCLHSYKITIIRLYLHECTEYIRTSRNWYYSNRLRDECTSGNITSTRPRRSRIISFDYLLLSHRIVQMEHSYIYVIAFRIMNPIAHC